MLTCSYAECSLGTAGIASLCNTEPLASCLPPCSVEVLPAPTYDATRGLVLWMCQLRVGDFVGGLAFLVRVCLWWFPALVPDCFCIPNHRVPL